MSGAPHLLTIAPAAFEVKDDSEWSDKAMEVEAVSTPMLSITPGRAKQPAHFPSVESDEEEEASRSAPCVPPSAEPAAQEQAASAYPLAHLEMGTRNVKVSATTSLLFLSQ